MILQYNLQLLFDYLHEIIFTSYDETFIQVPYHIALKNLQQNKFQA